jgi:hypothetical protein
LLEEPREIAGRASRNSVTQRQLVKLVKLLLHSQQAVFRFGCPCTNDFCLSSADETTKRDEQKLDARNSRRFSRSYPFRPFRFLPHKDSWSRETLHTLRISVHALQGIVYTLVDTNLFRLLTRN